MPQPLRTLDLLPADVASPAALQARLRAAEQNSRQEIVSLQLITGTNNPALRVHAASFLVNPDARKLPLLEVVAQPAGMTDEAFIAQETAGKIYVDFAEVALADGTKSVLLRRPGTVVSRRGKMSTFGGAADTGMREDEGLAIVGTDNFAAVVARHEALHPGVPLFTTAQNATGKPLGRALNPDAFYIACRWDYDHEIARKDLVKCTIRVRNALTEAEKEAVATDWGPHERTGRVADLSPGLAEALGLRTDDECVVLVSGPDIKPRAAATAPGTLTPTGAPGNLTVFSQAQLEQKFGTITPVQENGDGSFKILNPSFNTNIVIADISPLSGIRGVPNSGKVECHSAIKAALEGAAQDVAVAGKKNLILTWDGLFVPRHILWDEDRGFSTHSWGIAFDINVNWNGYGSRPAPSGSHGSVAELVSIFANRGFTWGGHWRTPDGMHFQYGIAT